MPTYIYTVYIYIYFNNILLYIYTSFIKNVTKMLFLQTGVVQPKKPWKKTQTHRRMMALAFTTFLHSGCSDVSVSCFFSSASSSLESLGAFFSSKPQNQLQAFLQQLFFGAGSTGFTRTHGKCRNALPLFIRIGSGIKKM